MISVLTLYSLSFSSCQWPGDGRGLRPSLQFCLSITRGHATGRGPSQPLVIIRPARRMIMAAAAAL